MTDADLLKLLATLGMDDLSFRVLPVLPLVKVAWADGDVHARERDKVQAFAETFAPGREGQLLVDNWLRYPPTELYYERGFAALSALAGREQSPLSLPSGVLERAQQAARDVARSHGGFFGLGAISRSEAEVLETLKQALLEQPGGLSPTLGGQEIPSRRRVTISCNTSTFDPSAENAVLVPDIAPDIRAVIEGSGLIVGSDADCGLRVESPQIAPHHARVAMESRRFYIEDLDSPTGVRVDGERVFKRRLLGGERIDLGDLGFTFKLLRRIPVQMLT